MVGPAPDAPVGTLWSVSTPGLIKSNPAVVGDLLVIVGGDTHVLGLDPATGEQRWSSAAGGYVGSPAASGDLAYVASDDGSLAALSLTDGTLQWTAPGQHGPLTAPLVVDDLVVAGGMDGRLTALTD
jgi:outer membrane protein assembly factor BamB